jgi:hypothetical protein
MTPTFFCNGLARGASRWLPRSMTQQDPEIAFDGAAQFLVFGAVAFAHVVVEADIEAAAGRSTAGAIDRGGQHGFETAAWIVR